MRGVCRAASQAPWTWRFLRRPVRALFDRLAPGWDERVGTDTPQRNAPLEAALGHVERAPGRALDIGTGTGSAAFFIADRYPEADVLGIDISAKMIDLAGEKAAGRPGRARFEVADIADFDPGQPYDLVTMMNMPPFFEQVSALLAPGGYVVSIASRGRTTPFYTPAAALERGFGRYGLRTLAADPDGTYYVAERPA
jgi:SAM-dependent methyltransferase